MASRLLWPLLPVLVAAACASGVTPIRTAFNRGVAYDAKGDLDDAIREYREALEENPDDHRARFNLAMAYEARAERLERDDRHLEAGETWRAAEQEYQAVLRQHPDHPRASINLAALVYGQDPERGKAMLRALIERHPDRAPPLAALAAHLLSEGDPRQAAELLERARRLEPASVQVNFLLGDARRELGEFDRAREAYERALLPEPDLSVLLALARVELVAGRPDEAEAYLRRALLVDEDHFEAHWLLAELYEARGRDELACEHLWWARRLRPERVDNPETHLRLLRLYERMAAAERARLEAADTRGAGR